MPPADQVRDALERILSSEVFARSERARDLLNYIVSQDLAGHADRLKGFSIAVDVFGKDGNFDPATDTVVRVQAGRLRDLLDQFYAAEGAGEALRIAIPRGSYVPVYGFAGDAAAGSEAPAAPPEAADAPEPDPLPPAIAAGSRRAWPSGRLAGIAAGFCVVLVLLAAAAYRYLAPPVSDAAETAAAGMVAPVDLAGLTGSVPQDLLPSVYIDLAVDGPGGDRVAASLRRGLSGFDTISFIARPTSQDGAAAHRPTDFVFVVDDSPAEGEFHLELQNVLSGKVLLSRNLMSTGRSQAEIDDEIADLLSSVAPVSSVIYASLAETGAHTPLTECLALNEKFYRDQNAAAHRAAYECLEALAAADLRSALVYSELASLHVQAVVSRYAHPPEPSTQQALAFARLGVQLGPNSPYAHRSMGYVLSRSASPEESLRWTRRAYELNTFDLGMAASYGYGLIFAGSYDEGTRILRRAVSAASAHPTWWDYGLFLGHFMRDDMQAAADAVSTLAASKRAHYTAARLIAADALGRRAEAAALLDEIRRDHASFAADPRAFFVRGSYPLDMTVKLVEALQAAGLSGEG